MRQGSGRLVYANGDVYEGDWVENKRNGLGKLLQASGYVYEGTWVDNKAHGFGCCTYVSGNTYEGNWASNRRHGAGKSVSVNGDVYIGNWSQDRKHGNGEITHSDGNKYEGMWEDNKPHGEGVYTYINGNVHTGSFVNGKLTSVAPAAAANPIVSTLTADAMATKTDSFVEVASVTPSAPVSIITPSTGFAGKTEYAQDDVRYFANLKTDMDRVLAERLLLEGSRKVLKRRITDWLKSFEEANGRPAGVKDKREQDMLYKEHRRIKDEVDAKDVAYTALVQECDSIMSTKYAKSFERVDLLNELEQIRVENVPPLEVLEEDESEDKTTANAPPIAGQSLDDEVNLKRTSSPKKHKKNNNIRKAWSPDKKRNSLEIAPSEQEDKDGYSISKPFKSDNDSTATLDNVFINRSQSPNDKISHENVLMKLEEVESKLKTAMEKKERCVAEKVNLFICYTARHVRTKSHSA